MTSASLIGQRTRLIEGDIKVTGKIRYVSDFQLLGMLHARLVTSPYPHARILNIDTTAALALPGIVAVITASDLPPIEPANRGSLLLARKRVIFAGQPVALILAEDEASAQDALDQVQVDYEPLPAAITLDEALADDAPLVWPDGLPGAAAKAVGSNGVGDDAAPRRSNVAGRAHHERGDIAAGFAAADVIVEAEFSLPMIQHNPLETQGCAVQIDPATDEITIWSSNQALYRLRKMVADIVRVPEASIRCIGTPVGGAFGGKNGLYEPLIVLAARLVKRPVRLILNRFEELVATNPTPAGRIRVKLGAKNDGTLTALAGQVIFNSGCFPSSPLRNSLAVLGSIYRIPNVTVDGLDVLSFKPSSGTYRAPGVPQAMFGLESMVDEIARKLDLDPLELRLQNAARPGDQMIHGETWPTMGMTEVLEALRDHPVWQNRATARAAGRGVGLALGSWPGGTGPASAACMLNQDGMLQIQIGSVDISGINTGFTMLAAEVFGLSPDKVKITSADTTTALFALNAGGSKMTYTVGPAIIQAVAEARRQTLETAAEIMEADQADLEIVDGRVQVTGVPDRAIGLGELARKTMQMGGLYRPIFGQGRSVITTRLAAFCAQLAEVEVDRETGAVQVHKLVVAQDVGKALNPLLIEGQMMGGATQGIGWALYEDMVYDEYGQPLTASWMDYTVPHIHQAARSLDPIIVEVPSEEGPFGARGVGEPSVTPTAAAIGNAITDAIGVRLTDLPMTPPRIVAALK
jgi:CO/xanthine dehydrogenase Mo-binding subunit